MVVVVLCAAPSPAAIQQGVEWVQRELAEGRSVYIHCAHGHGRSATVLAAVLIATGQSATAEQAVALMRWADAARQHMDCPRHLQDRFLSC